MFWLKKSYFLVSEVFLNVVLVPLEILNYSASPNILYWYTVLIAVFILAFSGWETSSLDVLLVSFVRCGTGPAAGYLKWTGPVRAGRHKTSQSSQAQIGKLPFTFWGTRRETFFCIKVEKTQPPHTSLGPEDQAHPGVLWPLRDSLTKGLLHAGPCLRVSCCGPKALFSPGQESTTTVI